MTTSADMQLKILLPTEVLLDQRVTKIVAEAANGEFCMLPRHIDFVAALVPGILSFWIEGDQERFIAVDEGMLVKCGDRVLVSTFHAVRGDDLDRLRATVTERFIELEEHERLARTALARLEAGTIRRFIDLEELGHG